MNDDDSDSDVDEDLALFRREVGDATPLKASPRVVHRRPRPPARALQRERDEFAVMRELLDDPGPEEGLETGEELLFLRPGVQKRFLARLRRGRYAVEDEIDLHGLDVRTAGDVLRRFIDEAVDHGAGCVRVIHGKGLKSRGKPKLKVMANRLLRRHPAVLAFASSPRNRGGTGAVEVLLSRGAR